MTERDAGEIERQCYQLGGVVVELSCRNRRWCELLGQRYGRFAVGGTPDIQVEMVVGERGEPDAATLHAARLQPPRLARSADGAIVLSGWEFSARGDGARFVVTGPCAVYPVDVLIQALWPTWVEGGLIVHGAALEGDGAGWLASGPSGSGKSTLAALLPERALCDELAGVFRRDGRFWVAGLPFWRGRRGAAPLAGVHLLGHGAAHRRRRAPVEEAFAALSRETYWPLFDPPRSAAALEVLAMLVEQVPVWRLDFHPDPSVWAALTAP